MQPLPARSVQEEMVVEHCFVVREDEKSFW